MLLGKAHVGGANRGDLVVAAWRRLGGRSELLAQQIQCAQADRELQFDLVLEIEIDQRARDPRLARDIVHLRGVKAGAREHDLGCIDDVGTAQLFFVLAALTTPAHGPLPCQEIGTASFRERVCPYVSMSVIASSLKTKQ